ncbi:MAG: hypothetical protein INH37_10385 [Myxococcaceae bacterium]|nr:hypothetical protein [Myxococcaceae bacterium]
MLLGLFTALALGGAPRGLADATLVTWAPKLSEVQTLLPFFTRAGEGSVMLSPASWRESAHPLVPFDVTRPESAAAVGIDVTQGLTLSTRGPVSVACHGLSDVKTFEATCRARLDRYGPVSRDERAGVTTLLSRDGLGRVQGAVVLKGREACAVHASGQSVERLLPEVTKALTGKPLTNAWVKAASALPAAQYFMVPDGERSFPGWATAALSAHGSALSVDLKSKGLPFASLEGAGPSPFGALTTRGVLVLRLRLSKRELSANLDRFLALAPGSAALRAVSARVSPALTGNVALVFSRVKVTSGLRTPTARFFAARFTALAETTDATAAREAVEALDAKALSFREGTLGLGVRENVLWLSNDAESRDEVLGALAGAAGAQRHGAELDVEPLALARALASVPLLEVVQAPELSPVLVVATELGPLPGPTREVRGWLDGGPSGQRGQLTWALAPPPAGAPDAGR